MLPTQTEQRFPEQLLDEETAPYCNMFREYALPKTGRYLQSNPIGLLDGWNTYAYVDGNPIIYTDLLGLFVGEDFIIALVDSVNDLIYKSTGGWIPEQTTINYFAGLGDSLSMGLSIYLLKRYK